MSAVKKIKGKQSVAGTVKKVVLKKKVSIKSKTAPLTGSKVKPKPVKCETMTNKSTTNEEIGVPKFVKVSVTESVSDAEELTEKLDIRGGNMEESVPLECTVAENQPQTGDSKLEPYPATSETMDKNCKEGEEAGEKRTIAGNSHEDGIPVDAENQPEAGQSKNTPVLGACVSPKEIVTFEKTTVVNTDSQPEAVKCVKTEDSEPMQLGLSQSTHLQEVNKGTISKREKSPLDILTDEASRKPAAPPLETPPPGSPAKASQHAEPNLSGAAQSTAETTQIKTETLDKQQSDHRLKTKQEGKKTGFFVLPVVKQTKSLWYF